MYKHPNRGSIRKALEGSIKALQGSIYKAPESSINASMRVSLTIEPNRQDYELYKASEASIKAL